MKKNKRKSKLLKMKILKYYKKIFNNKKLSNNKKFKKKKPKLK